MVKWSIWSIYVQWSSVYNPWAVQRISRCTSSSLFNKHAYFLSCQIIRVEARLLNQARFAVINVIIMSRTIHAAPI